MFLILKPFSQNSTHLTIGLYIKIIINLIVIKKLFISFVDKVVKEIQFELVFNN
jgi:hypothetical protein